MRIRTIREDYDAAGSVHTLMAPWAFVSDDTFVTKAGDLGIVYRLQGRDYEGLDHAERRHVVHRYAAALRLLDERMRVSQYVIKRRLPPLTAGPCTSSVVHGAVQARARFMNAHADDLSSLELYLVLLYEGLAESATWATTIAAAWRDPRAALRGWLSPMAVRRIVDTQLAAGIAQLHHVAQAFEVHLEDTVHPRRLDRREAFAFLRRLVNYDPSVCDTGVLVGDGRLDRAMSSSSIACEASHLEVGETLVNVLTMREPPTATFALILEGLYAVPGEFIACLEWNRVPADRIRREIHARRRHHHNRRISLVNYVAPGEPQPNDMLIDESETSVVRQLGDALTEVEVDGHFFGECSLTVALLAPTAQRLAESTASALKVLAAHDGAFHIETYNLVNAWAALVPGNRRYNLRRLALLETHCADLGFLFTLDQGQPTAAALGGREALAVLETSHRTPYFYNLHVNDVGHTLVLGATGSGKSFLCNFLVTHAQKYDPMTVIFDVGHSYRKLASALGASYLALGHVPSGVCINPFAHAPTPEHLHFLTAFVRVLLDGDRPSTLTDTDDRELYEAIQNLYVLDRPQHRLSTLANMLPRPLHDRLRPWIDTGRFAHVFDHATDTLSVHPFQVFDFEAMGRYQEILEPLLFYVLHRVQARILDDQDARRLKLCVIDEAWRFIKHPKLHAYVEDALKTWRKYNASMWLATQAVQDLRTAALVHTVIENSPTTLFLANPKLDQAQYAELFQLNTRQLTQLASLQPRGEMLLKRPDVSKVLRLSVDADSYWLYSNTPADTEKARAVSA
ncbi:MAG: hypothetical protein ABJA98_27875 [Acidobacteriota bacterium]